MRPSLSRVTAPWALVAAAAVLLALTMGARTSFGLLLSPLNTATGLGLATISFAAAAGQLAWGAAQPVVGMLADRHGPVRIIAAGGLLLAASTALLPLVQGAAALTAVFVLMAVTGAAAGSNALLLGAVNQRVDHARRGLAAGIVSAGGSAGPLLMAPLVQGVTGSAGWVAATLVLAVLALPALPLSRAFAPRRPAVDVAPVVAAAARRVRAQLRDRRFILVTASFFVCGFHVAFFTTHMPGVIALCGLPMGFAGLWLAVAGLANVVGSLAAGVAAQRVAPGAMLAALYAVRGLTIALFLATPTSAGATLAFGVLIGLTQMAVLPPTTALVSRIAAGHNLGMLLGVSMMIHQLGAFFGAWAGGLAVAATGAYDAVWLADIVLSVIAVALCLALRERGAQRPQVLQPA